MIAVKILLTHELVFYNIKKTDYNTLPYHYNVLT